jgi:hypothetical protein
MVNTNKLKSAIDNFTFYSRPSSTSSNTPCTVGDVNKVINNLAELFNTFVDELENK